jgi:transcriptional regulator with XRE-family HTH domain
MSGKRITNRQENLYMNKRQQGQSQETAAAKGGISERSGRRIEKGERPSIPKERHWRTREDPLDAIWEKELGEFQKLIYPSARSNQDVPFG